ncbi:MAG: ATP-binding cassette domain-containing protein [Chloroflexi bacterium]|nr:MAG: ATP-binding cassette domain-containing protein [Chloroflexota bacterium]
MRSLPRPAVRVLLLGAGAVLAAIVYPQVASRPNLDQAAIALSLAGPAAGTALAAAAGRPLLAGAALSGVAAYVSGLLATHGVAVPVSVLAGTGAATAGGALCAVVGWRLEGPAFLVATLLLALAGGAAVQALPDLTRAEAGLTVPSFAIPLSKTRAAVFTPAGDFHLLLGVAAAVTAIAAVLIAIGPGARWRAIGSDRQRAADLGIRPFAGELATLAITGAMAGVCGALAAHVARVATPAFFAPDVAALALLAALAAGRDPLYAALVAAGTGLVGTVILPAARWQGPPDAMSLALGVLAVATLFSLLPSRVEAREPAEPEIDASSEWPLAELHLGGALMRVPAISLRARDGTVLVDAPAFEVRAGTVHALVGPNGAGKTTLLRAIAQRGGRRGSGVEAVGADGALARVILLPQEGGGFASCTVSETLELAALRNRSRAAAGPLATAWRRRLGLEGRANSLCADLSTGQRRLLDLARVLLAGPRVLLCDEPLAGLDDNHRAAARECLRAAAKAGLTVLIAEHDREAVASLADSVLTLERHDAGFVAGGAAATA